MDEMKPSGGQRQVERIDRALVAVRSSDRRTLISPTQDHPDFFDVSLSAERISTESKIIGSIASEYGIVVNNDHALRSVSGEPTILGWATYLRHTRDYTRTQTFGHYGVSEIKEYRNSLQNTSEDQSQPNTVRRDAHIKAELFKRVIDLFS